MPNSKSVSFAAPPTDYALELQDIERRKALAQALQQQGMQGSGGTEMVGGWAIPKSPMEGLGKAAQQVSGAYQNKQLLGEERQLAQRLREQGQSDAGNFAQALNGTPAQAPLTPNDDEGNAMPGVAAQPGSRQKALAIALQSQNPVVANAGSSILAEMLKTPEGAFSKVDAKDYTPESIKLFATGGGHDYSVLVPVRKKEVANLGGNSQVIDPYAAQTGAVLPHTVRPDTNANIAMKLYEFNNLSAAEKARLQNEAAKIGISAQELYFNTGQQGGGAFKVPQGPNPPFQLPGANPAAGMPPQGAPGMAPAAPQGQMPQATAQPMPAPQVAAPRPAATPVAAAPGGVVLPPKARVAIEQARQENVNSMNSKREFNMGGINETIDEARKILTGQGGALPTSSGAGSLLDSAASFVGIAPKGSAQADQLRALGGALTSKVPRMEGPQSDKDVELYRQMAGDVGNASLPIKRRLAALDEVQRLYGKYEHLNRGAGVPGAAPLGDITERRGAPRTGNRIVVDY